MIDNELVLQLDFLIEHCFSEELLPGTISSDILGGHQSVSGPYTHFQDLGIVRRGEETFYRITCVGCGGSTRSTQPRGLVLEFNEHSVSVKELSWPTNFSAGLGFISSYNFVGSCTFSCPYIPLKGSCESGPQERGFLVRHVPYSIYYHFSCISNITQCVTFSSFRFYSHHQVGFLPLL